MHSGSGSLVIQATPGQAGSFEAENSQVDTRLQIRQIIVHLHTIENIIV